jgi:hypothetical protein
VTGPEHYREAERIMDALYGRGRGSVPGEATYAAEAQVHATLALAAATALGHSRTDQLAWADIAGTGVLR